MEKFNQFCLITWRSLESIIVMWFTGLVYNRKVIVAVREGTSKPVFTGFCWLLIEKIRADGMPNHQTEEGWCIEDLGLIL